MEAKETKETKTYNPVAIANYFIWLSKYRFTNGLSLMQLLKLSYLAHGFKLAYFDHPLADEYAEAWQYGPVFPSIFHEFKIQDNPIQQMAETLNETTKQLEPWKEPFTPNEQKIMRGVYTEYGQLDAWQLSSLTHTQGTPWHKAWQTGKHIRGFSISNDDIKAHFKLLLSSRNEKTS